MYWMIKNNRGQYRRLSVNGVRAAWIDRYQATKILAREVAEVVATNLKAKATCVVEVVEGAV